MKKVKDIERKIDEILKTANKDQRRSLNSLKNMILSQNDKIYYEANYDKRLCVANYNKFMADVEELDKKNICFIFIRVPNILHNYYIGNANKETDKNFLKSLKLLMPTLDVLRKYIYLVNDYITLVTEKRYANEVYLKVKTLKESKVGWQRYQCTYIRYKKYSAKINKNISACIKQANNIFEGKQNS